MKNQQASHLVIFGSSRSDGNTRKAMELVTGNRNVEVVDLSELDISYFDYANANINDDFIPLAEKMQKYESLILVTPVYWYTMSAVMKTFIDRWSDLLTVRKDLGRGLVGKKLFLICSYGTSFPIGFEDPFRLTCDYMKMSFGGCYYHYCGKDEQLLSQNLRNAESFQILL